MNKEIVYTAENVPLMNSDRDRARTIRVPFRISDLRSDFASRAANAAKADPCGGLAEALRGPCGVARLGARCIGIPWIGGSAGTRF